MKYSQELLGGAGCGEKTVAVGNWRVWQDVRGSLMASDMSESLKFGVKFTPKNCRVLHERSRTYMALPAWWFERIRCLEKLSILDL